MTASLQEKKKTDASMLYSFDDLNLHRKPRQTCSTIIACLINMKQLTIDHLVCTQNSLEKL